MKKKVKQILSALLVAVMLVGISAIDSETIKVKAAGYDATAAVKFANNHWNDGIGLCAEFVSRCLNAGGISIPNRSYYSSSTKSYANNSGTLGAYTNPYTCSASLLLYLSENYTIITNPSNSDIDVGDVVFMYSMSNGKLKYRDGHVGICVKKDNGAPKYAAHNKAQASGGFSSGYPCTYVAKMSKSSAHSHSYSYNFEAAHPHRVYAKCSCGDWYYTGETKAYNNCSECMKLSWAFVQPFYAYTISTGKTVVYDAVNGNAKSNKIYDTDLCTIEQVYACDWCKVTFPLDSGGTDVGYCKVTVFMKSGGFIMYASKRINTYIRSDLSQKLGYADAGDKIYIAGFTSSAVQIAYPLIGGGYKVGWIPNSALNYTISYNSNGGSGSMSSGSTTYQNSFKLSSNAFSKSGYSFAGWNVYRKSDGKWYTLKKGWQTEKNINANGYTKSTYSNGMKATLDQSWVNLGATSDTLTFYAVWKANTYTVSYNANGGQNAPTGQTKTGGKNLTLSSAKPTGKSFTVSYNANGGNVSSSSKTVSQTFTNWNTAANGRGTAYNAGATYSANASVTLYAQYANPSIGFLPTPTRSGYAFDGWYTAANGGTKITDSTKVTANTTVYAHWKANAYTVSYNVNGGTGSIASQTKTHGTNLTLTTTKPTGKSFTVSYNANGGNVSSSSKTVSQTFTNWNTAANGRGTAYNAGATYSANASVTLYAQYANPSIGFLPTPTRSGYAFDGWYTAANGGTKITDSTKVTANTTVYAHWKANAYTVSYNVNGGTGSIASQTKTHGTNLTLTTTKPTGKSFTVSYNANGGNVSSSSKTVSQTFTNWNTAANGSGTAYNAGATYSANASVTLYAQYANPSIGSLPTPTRSGYAFDGWYTAANGGTKITDSTKVTANTTVYAHWTKNAETKAVVEDVKIEHNATVNYKSTYMLSPEITADKGAKYTVKYSSSNTKVATVDENGKIYGAKKGNATITCTVTDSYGNIVTDKCNVNVDYSGAQWFIIIVLFGWIWYI